MAKCFMRNVLAIKHRNNSFISLLFPGMFFLTAMSLPMFLRIDYGLIGKSTVTLYRLVWRYFISGQHPAYPITETPKPLVCFLYYYLPIWGVYLLISLSAAATCYALSELSKKIAGRRLWGLLAFTYVILVMHGSIRALIFCYWEWLYAGLTASAILFWLNKRYRSYSILMLLSSLVRPESWLYALIVPYFHFRDGSKGWTAWLLLPLAGPLLWMGFDRATFGDPLYSLHMTAKYKEVLGMATLGFLEFVGSVPRIISQAIGLSVTIIGLASLLWMALRSLRNKESPHIFLLAVISLPVIFYLLLSAWGGIVFMERFIIIPNIFLIFYAFLSPSLLKLDFKRITAVSLVFFAVMMAINIKPGDIHAAFSDGAKERKKTAIVESNISWMSRYADSLKASIIVPYRRKMVTDYLLPQKHGIRLFSFREIVYENAVNGTDIHQFSPAIALFIEDDFSGIENGFSFLNESQTYRLIDYLAFTPLTAGRGYIIYKLSSDTIWSPPMEFEAK